MQLQITDLPMTKVMEAKFGDWFPGFVSTDKFGRLNNPFRTTASLSEFSLKNSS